MRFFRSMTGKYFRHPRTDHGAWSRPTLETQGGFFTALIPRGAFSSRCQWVEYEHRRMTFQQIDKLPSFPVVCSSCSILLLPPPSIDCRRFTRPKRRCCSPAIVTRFIPFPRMVQGAFLNLGGSIGLVLLDTLWTRVGWDGGVAFSGGGRPGAESTKAVSQQGAQLISPQALNSLDLELSRDSELRLLVVFVRVSQLP